ncbi:peptidoglycan-binding protein [Sinorhizobium meliloti]|uniref:Lysozyme n=1 Tax=Rhizobium meliloti TaxID=382 RepID=A0A6A7ZXW7_RHIML|nr:peptidoglycan-binding protein [Sinorhizobium meliloti]MDW9376815.1 peptidoglycan-binding protein [Sinorhizobium meliloti]MDW9495373.1 peptidoglycan-binding protein [Sinorhizobium meliloti]MDW9563728.1 peptidoglycan-binding protein [Sinorhizobium meliloti]MDW9651138.1 peptidoglycan-binding protein [Sinorhizobium meliloti]MDW9861612.1 peptidoglycan-binding protein [Sinorhizobium meliloti]
MTITTTSPRGRAFMRGHEGNPLTCYLDPVGIPTIGTGFTTRSAAVRRALAKLGITKLVPGKTKITSQQSDEIFTAVLSEEFEPAVVARSPATRTQHQMDAAVSAIYNLGIGAMEWAWADLWRADDVHAAAAYLGSHYNTAGGKKLPGLVRRRKEEADLFLNGRYATGGAVKESTTKAPKKPDPVVKEAQSILTSRGFNPGAIDGWMGEKTKAAIIAYQKAHPHLEADGILGPATLSQLRRDAKALREAATKGAGSAVGSGALAFMAGLPWGWIAAGALLLAFGYVAYRYRDVIARRWNTWRGKEAAV